MFTLLIAALVCLTAPAADNTLPPGHQAYLTAVASQRDARLTELVDGIAKATKDTRIYRSKRDRSRMLAAGKRLKQLKADLAKFKANRQPLMPELNVGKLAVGACGVPIVRVSPSTLHKFSVFGVRSPTEALIACTVHLAHMSLPRGPLIRGSAAERRVRSGATTSWSKRRGPVLCIRGTPAGDLVSDAPFDFDNRPWYVSGTMEWEDTEGGGHTAFVLEPVTLPLPSRGN